MAGRARRGSQGGPLCGHGPLPESNLGANPGHRRLQVRCGEAAGAGVAVAWILVLHVAHVRDIRPKTDQTFRLSVSYTYWR
eukprot:scaffold544712_cov29-Prasinocladus_malaysianus.AAC.1